MKKIIALLLALLLVISTFAACDIVEKETDAPKEEQSETEEPKEEQSETEEPEEESEKGSEEKESEEKESEECVHVDEDKNHSCDNCNAAVEAHADSETDGDHKCDYCGATVTSCADSDKNHDCDECGADMGIHADSANDGDHVCDYGCGVALTSCNDSDKNHDCDECGADMGIHADSANDGDHKCDYCGATVTSCADSDNDHDCDDCGATVGGGTHTHNYVNNTCTICNLYRNGKTVKFGSYPQSEVTDNALKSTLNSMAGILPTSSNSQAWTSYGYYAEEEVRDYMWYIDLEIDGVKYRGVYFTSYRPENYDSVSSDGTTYQDDNGYSMNTVYWFKYEPISWTIISENESNGTIFVVCDMIIDSQEFYKDYSEIRVIGGKNIYANNYAHSAVREWLNETFYNTAFDMTQMQSIITTMVDNSAESTGEISNSYVCEDTQDKIYLLSYQDVVNTNYGFLSDYSEPDNARKKYNTDYANSQGAFVGPTGEGYWWLRSPYDFEDSGVFVVGDYGLGGHTSTDYNIVGIVPALQIRL